MRVIDLITNLDMSAFHSLGGWDKMLARLEMEWKECAHEAPTILPAKVKPALDQRGDGQEEQGTAMYAHFFEVTLVVHAPHHQRRCCQSGTLKVYGAFRFCIFFDVV